MAVDLSKLSLWLATLAKEHPFTFLDHSLRCGDSLVGLSREQISSFHWDEAEIAKQKKIDATKLIRDPIPEQIHRATEYRQQILVARDENPYDDLQQKLVAADEALSLVVPGRNNPSSTPSMDGPYTSICMAWPSSYCRKQCRRGGAPVGPPPT